MNYKFEFTSKAEKNLSKLDRYSQQKILSYISKNLINTNNPYNSQYKKLFGLFKNYGRYKIGNYRLIVKIKKDTLIIMGVNVAHRKEVYKQMISDID